MYRVSDVVCVPRRHFEYCTYRKRFSGNIRQRIAGKNPTTASDYRPYCSVHPACPVQYVFTSPAAGRPHTVKGHIPHRPLPPSPPGTFFGKYFRLSRLSTRTSRWIFPASNHDGLRYIQYDAHLALSAIMKVTTCFDAR